MNYEEMGDLEINKRVAEAVGMELSSEECGSYVRVVKRSIDCLPNYMHFNFCNNPSDAWPIVMKSKIDIQHRDGFNVPCAKHCEHMHADKNPLRAAMIVFLMMQEQDE